MTTKRAKRRSAKTRPRKRKKTRAERKSSNPPASKRVSGGARTLDDDGLNHQQRMFVLKYVETDDGPLSALSAGYSPRNPAVSATRLLSYVSVRTAITKLRARTIERAELRIEEVLEEYRRIGFAKITDVVTVEGLSSIVKPSSEWPPDVIAAVSEIRPTKDGVALKLHSKVTALDRLYTHLHDERPPVALSDVYALKLPGDKPKDDEEPSGD